VFSDLHQVCVFIKFFILIFIIFNLYSFKFYFLNEKQLWDCDFGSRSTRPCIIFVNLEADLKDHVLFSNLILGL
jgi:hypothetical protein